ncbi:MAG: AIR synthase family protein [Acidobacteriota bacterium]
MIPVGKLPPEILFRLLGAAGQSADNARVIVGPGLGLDCAVLDFGDRYLVAKTDPITFATDEIGWYAVQVNANDIACSGALPLFFLATIILPESPENERLAESIFAQIQAACVELGVTLVGGHTEVTYGTERPIVSGAMLGEVEKDRLVTAAGACEGDAVILTKGYPIEAVSIIARETELARKHFDAEFLSRCREFLRKPGISVVRDAQIATRAGKVTAMHDPTEGGVATGLWELAEASGKRVEVGGEGCAPLACRPVLLEEGELLCSHAGLDPLGCIASGALLITTPEPEPIQLALQAHGIPAYCIGKVVSGSGTNVRHPDRDELAKLFSATAPGRRGVPSRRGGRRPRLASRRRMPATPDGCPWSPAAAA